MERSKTVPRCNCAMNILAPQSLVDAVRERAAQNYQSANSYVRGALVRQLALDGAKINDADAA